MVGRTKPQNNMEPSITGDLYAAEVKFLKEKNANLAKALSDSKIAYSHIVAERDMIQQELFLMKMRYTKLLSFIKDVDLSARACMNTIVSSSSYITNILQLTNNATVKLKNESTRNTSNSFFNNNVYTSPEGHKMSAVKPMIDGHVIFRPTINLRRVNELSQAELRSHETSPNVNSTENISASSRSFDNNLNNSNGTNTFRSVRPRMEVNPLTETPSNHEELSREYMDEENANSSEGTSSINNGLDTVNEEEEDDLEETRQEMLGSTNTNSLNMQGNNAQVPLLSGVFRDVRVYLSPMQNTTQCTDLRQHINTERGSGKTNTLSRRSSSVHLPRSGERLSNSSMGLIHASTEHRRNMNFGNNEEENMSNSSNDSPENSFDSALQPSLLSSTRISLPKPGHSPLKTASPNWNCVLKRRRSSNCLNRSENSNCSAREEQHLVENGKRLSLLNNNQPSTSSSVNTDYDPLEGPSSLLDSQNGDTVQKNSFLESVGLVSLNSIPSSTPESNTRNTRKTKQVTQRKIIEKRKSVISSKVAKVMLTRMSLSNNSSGSSSRRSLESLEISRNSENSQRRLSKSPTRNIKQNNNSNHKLSSPRKLKTTISGYDNSPLPRRRTKKSYNKQSSEENIHKKSKSKSARGRSRNNSSPQRPARARRAVQVVSLKEQSLKKKMRRSK
ncbi:hypothetical protein ILUMI_04926 [Ignelater luminosus]|uniref:Shugoshin C-terminal domain-containing protein n=1 Tax=Ignelater luminosus TaxID=2038154 RepID=A0A8K0GIL1_IGNLU|nr:hypothetical protein ILUMI_04926 [Ignelater luminosus]